MLQRHLTARLIAETKRIERIVPAPSGAVATAWGDGTLHQRYFPLFRRPQRLNLQWAWRVAYLESDNYEFRLLAEMRHDKPNYKAWLIVKMDAGWAMVARLESHMHSGGIHCHVECGPALSIGEIEPPGQISLPHWKDSHRRPHVLRSPREWWEIALKFFRVNSPSGGSLL
jgi:hypothetical protein